MSIEFNSSQQRAIAAMIAIILIATVVIKVVLQTNRAYKDDEITIDTIETLDNSEPIRKMTIEERKELQLLLNSDI